MTMNAFKRKFEESEGKQPSIPLIDLRGKWT